eukprot:676536-Pyramimonas_sp.AAC.1
MHSTPIAPLPLFSPCVQFPLLSLTALPTFACCLHHARVKRIQSQHSSYSTLVFTSAPSAGRVSRNPPTAAKLLRGDALPHSEFSVRVSGEQLRDLPQLLKRIPKHQTPTFTSYTHFYTFGCIPSSALEEEYPAPGGGWA